MRVKFSEIVKISEILYMGHTKLHKKSQGDYREYHAKTI